MRRKRVNPRKDKRKFRQSANKTKMINVSPKVMRGGIRL